MEQRLNQRENVKRGWNRERLVTLPWMDVLSWTSIVPISAAPIGVKSPPDRSEELWYYVSSPFFLISSRLEDHSRPPAKCTDAPLDAIETATIDLDGLVNRARMTESTEASDFLEAIRLIRDPAAFMHFLLENPGRQSLGRKYLLKIKSI